MASAHSLGIIHKDLKPSNILVRETQGIPKPVVADFGIGVLTDRTQLDKRNITETGILNTLLGNESSRTGTRLYAPPESLLGKPATTGFDVYAMGVFLYQVLIGNFDQPLGTGWEETLPDSGSISTTLLIADIHEATRVDPTKRLLNLSTFAERLRSLDQRVAQRKKEIANAALADRIKILKRAVGISTIAAVSLGGLSVYAWQQRNLAQANAIKAAENEAKAVAAADSEKKRADELAIEKQRVQAAQRETHAAYRSARRAVDQFFTEVSESSLLNQPGLQTLRRDLLTDARTYYQEFAKSRGGIDWASDVSASNYNLARVYELLGDNKLASETYDLAIDSQSKILQTDANDASAKSLLSDMLNAKSRLLQVTGDLTGSEALNEQALALRQALVESAPDEAEHVRKLANSFMNRGILALRQDDPAAAKPALLKAQELRAKFVTTASNTALIRDQAKGFYNLALLHQQLVEDTEAFEALQQSVVLLQRLVQEHPTDLEMLYLLATCWRTLGDNAMDKEQPDLAIDYFNRALAQLKILVERNPEVPQYKLGLAGIYINLATLKEADGVEARVAIDAACSILRSIATTGGPTAQRDLALALRMRAETRDTNENNAALNDLKEAEAILTSLQNDSQSLMDVKDETDRVRQLIEQWKTQ